MGVRNGELASLGLHNAWVMNFLLAFYFLHIYLLLPPSVPSEPT